MYACLLSSRGFYPFPSARNVAKMIMLMLAFSGVDLNDARCLLLDVISIWVT